MIFGKMWAAFRAQLNKLANLFWEADPIAQMRYEYDRSVEELKDGRQGLEMYRGLVEKVTRQVTNGRDHVAKLQAQTKAYLKAGDRATAAKFALEMEKANKDLAANEEQLTLHEKSYENNLRKIQHATKKLGEVKDRIKKYEADLKMSEAEAEITKLSEQFDFNITTDFGQLESVVQDRIDTNRGKVRVSADLSQKGIADIEAETRMEEAMAEDALKRMEIELGIRTPETQATETPSDEPVQKDLGPAQTN
ncbi:MAG: PspA/IM30 family protein [Xanthomonadales bacterium]|nr:PspA/IM30 family protein [Xanthomonadales bacterium]